MGPRSDNRGYDLQAALVAWAVALQWVRGLITAVIPRDGGLLSAAQGLQWVRGLITAVIVPAPAEGAESRTLQWVRGLITAVIVSVAEALKMRGQVASMGPRSDNRGYFQEWFLISGASPCFNGSAV